MRSIYEITKQGQGTRSQIMLTSQKSRMAAWRHRLPKSRNPTIENDLGKQIYRAAAELKASESAMMPQVVREFANWMSLEDLLEDLKAKVQQSEEIARPNFQPGAISDKLINQFR